MTDKIFQHPYAEHIKRFEVTIQPPKTMWGQPEPVTMTVGLSWLDGKTVDDTVEAVTTNHDVIRGKIIGLRPIREEV